MGASPRPRARGRAGARHPVGVLRQPVRIPCPSPAGDAGPSVRLLARGAPPHLAGLGHLLVRDAAAVRLRDGGAARWLRGRRRLRPRRRPQLPRLRRAGAARRSRDDHRRRRVPVARAGPHQVGQVLLGHDRDPADRRRRGRRSPRLPRGAPGGGLRRLHRDDAAVRPARLGAGRGRAPAGAGAAGPGLRDASLRVGGGQERAGQLPGHLPARDHPAVPALGGVLPGGQPRTGRRVGRPADAAVARRRPDPHGRAGHVAPAAALGHVAYLAVLAAVGYWWSVRRLSGRMLR